GLALPGRGPGRRRRVPRVVRRAARPGGARHGGLGGRAQPADPPRDLVAEHRAGRRVSLRTSRAVRVTGRDGAVSHAEHGPWHAADALASWGSVSKVMVAAVARALVESRALAWSTTVAEVTGDAVP